MSPNTRWGYRLLACMVGAFAVIVVANGTLMYFARTSNSGLVSTQAYEQGLAYNQTLAQRQQQSQLGWHLTRAQAFTPTHMVYTLTQVSGTALTGAALTMQAQHQVKNLSPVNGMFTEIEPGQYQLQVSWPSPGPWQATLRVTWGGRTLVAVESLVVQP